MERYGQLESAIPGGTGGYNGCEVFVKKSSAESVKGKENER